VTAGCEHGVESHDGTAPSMASAPAESRAWLLIEHPGPWPHEPTETAVPAGHGGAGALRGRAGQPKAIQEAEHPRLARTGALELTDLALLAQR
jgi:hypothetical protein